MVVELTFFNDEKLKINIFNKTTYINKNINFKNLKYFIDTFI